MFIAPMRQRKKGETNEDYNEDDNDGDNDDNNDDDDDEKLQNDEKIRKCTKFKKENKTCEEWENPIMATKSGYFSVAIFNFL